MTHVQRQTELDLEQSITNLDHSVKHIFMFLCTELDQTHERSIKIEAEVCISELLKFFKSLLHPTVSVFDVKALLLPPLERIKSSGASYHNDDDWA